MKSLIFQIVLKLKYQYIQFVCPRAWHSWSLDLVISMIYIMVPFCSNVQTKIWKIIYVFSHLLFGSFPNAHFWPVTMGNFANIFTWKCPIFGSFDNFQDPRSKKGKAKIPLVSIGKYVYGDGGVSVSNRSYHIICYTHQHHHHHYTPTFIHVIHSLCLGFKSPKIQNIFFF